MSVCLYTHHQSSTKVFMCDDAGIVSVAGGERWNLQENLGPVGTAGRICGVLHSGRGKGKPLIVHVRGTT